jgi:predicted O-methyltransferase YrrM
MRRLLFALAYASNGDSILGIGTYVGYVIAWLVGGVVCRTERTEVIGVDPDDDANRLARRNLSTLHGITRLKILDAEAKAVLPTLDTRFDIVLLDLDSPLTGKLGYVEVLEMAAEWLPSGALVVAHDASVPRFADDFVAYHSLVNGHPRLRGPWVLAVDECGLSVAVVS